jgi:hypothetical protein
MILVKQEIVDCLSFCDTPVKKMFLIPEKKILKIEVTYAFIKDRGNSFFKNRTQSWLGEGVLIFKDWDSLDVLLYDQNGENPVTLEKSSYEQLEDILIFEKYNKNIKICGFGIKTGHWVEWNITDSKYYGEFEEYEKND